MSLQTRLELLIAAIGSDVKRLDQKLNYPVLYVWRVGDGDPTFGGTKPVPATSRWELQLGSTTPIPSWAPDKSKVVRSPEWGT